MHACMLCEHFVLAHVHQAAKEGLYNKLHEYVNGNCTSTHLNIQSSDKHIIRLCHHFVSPESYYSCYLAYAETIHHSKQTQKKFSTQALQFLIASIKGFAKLMCLVHEIRDRNTTGVQILC